MGRCRSVLFWAWALMTLALTAAACQSSPAASPTAIPAANPTPIPAASPTAIPTPVTDLRIVELDPEYPPSAVSGERYVSLGLDREFYLGNISTGETRQLTTDGHRKREPAISGDHVAWTDQRRQLVLDNSSRVTAEDTADDIFLLNLEMGEQERITDVPANRRYLRMSGRRLVWMDNRNELEEHYTYFDIYAYDIVTGQEFPVAVAPGAQSNPAIYGDTVVWEDNRNSPIKGASKSDCTGCPENKVDINLYDFATGEEKPVIESGSFNGSPSVYQDFIVWEGFLPGRAATIYLLDLRTGERLQIAETSGRMTKPLVTDHHVVWTVRTACDVRPTTRQGAGAFARDLNTGALLQLSDYVEPKVITEANVALVTEGCFIPQRVFAVFLDG